MGLGCPVSHPERGDTAGVSHQSSRPKHFLREDHGLSPALFQPAPDALLLLATPLLNRIRLNSQNNGKPPSAGSDATPERAADP